MAWLAAELRLRRAGRCGRRWLPDEEPGVKATAVLAEENQAQRDEDQHRVFRQLAADENLPGAAAAIKLDGAERQVTTGMQCKRAPQHHQRER